MHDVLSVIICGHNLFVKFASKDSVLTLFILEILKKICPSFKNRIYYVSDINKMLEGLPEYYVPSGTHDAFNYVNGKWIYSSNVDVRMKEKR